MMLDFIRIIFNDSCVGLVQQSRIFHIFCSVDRFVCPSPVTVCVYTIIRILIQQLILILANCFPMYAFDTQLGQIINFRVGIKLVQNHHRSFFITTVPVNCHTVIGIWIDFLCKVRSKINDSAVPVRMFRICDSSIR